MFHLDNNSGVSAMPPVGTVQSSAPRWFTEGGGGTPASYPGADWYNIIQAELLNFLSAYGIAPDKADLSQLRKAIEAAIKDKATAKSPLLTAIAALVTSADKMPYFNGKDSVAMTALTAFAREVLAQTDAAGVLSKLGLTDIGIGADTPGADKPLLTGAKSSGFYIYGGGSDADFGPDFGVVITILYDAVSDIRVQMYIPLTNHSGTSPIIRGIHSGATTWKYKLYSENNKPSLSELGLSAGSPPIGIPFFWPSSAMPNTVMPEWSEMVFLKMNDATFSANTYPLLAKVWPSLKLTDCRGEFIRIADDGRGVDAGRTVLSAQGDTIQNITGEIGTIQYVGPVHEEGALYAGGSQWKTITTDGGNTVAQSVFFDASRAVRTSTETRPRNIAFNLLVRAK